MTDHSASGKTNNSMSNSDFILAHRDIFDDYITDGDIEEHRDAIIEEMRDKWAALENELFHVSRILYDSIESRLTNGQPVSADDFARPLMEVFRKWESDKNG